MSRKKMNFTVVEIIPHGRKQLSDYSGSGGDDDDDDRCIND